MVGTGVLGSSLSMNKIVAKKLLQKEGVPVNNYLAYHFRDKTNIKFEQVQKKLGMPVMVKSASLGSSVGVSKVTKKTEFKKAIDEAFRYDDELIIEEFVEGREIECAVLGNTPPEASYPGEIVINDGYDFYTFDAKYVDEKAVDIKVPASLKDEEIKTIREVSVRAYQTLHCQDFSRVDLFVTKRGKVYVNEINTIPGFTNSSMYPMMWKERGLSFTNLITKLIELAKSRYEAGKRVIRDFDSALNY
jgi:D-alanine-D-alanine ligase